VSAKTGSTLTGRRVAVVGLGLMGGSLAGALRGQCRRVTGVDVDPETVATARARGFVDAATTDLAAGVREADLVVLATPVRTILQLLEEIGPLLRPGTVVMDLGSTKAAITAKMTDLPDAVVPLGGHPMCGKERAGIAAADPELYRGATFILTPLERTTDAALDLGRAVAAAVEAHPLLLDAERQDKLTATVSHLPYLLACALVATADATTSSDPAAWEIVAGGFRDTSRVSGSDVTMMLDILLTNREPVLHALTTCIDQLQQLGALIADGDEAALRTTLTTIRNQRKEMYP
jgi:prephenate dehydrogenase